VLPSIIAFIIAQSSACINNLSSPPLPDEAHGDPLPPPESAQNPLFKKLLNKLVGYSKFEP
jgi:hypothetical protein